LDICSGFRRLDNAYTFVHVSLEDTFAQMVSSVDVQTEKTTDRMKHTTDYQSAYSGNFRPGTLLAVRTVRQELKRFTLVDMVCQTVIILAIIILIELLPGSLQYVVSA